MNKELLQKAQQLYQQGELNQALEIYRQLLTEEPNNGDLLHQIGGIYAQLQDYNNSLIYLDFALHHQPNSAPIYNSKGNVLIRQGNLSGALTCYRQAIKMNPHYAIAYNNIGRCLYLQDKFTAAQKSYAKAIELNPRFADAYYNQGVLLLKLGDLAQAQVSLEKALSLNFQSGVIYGQMAQIYLQKAEYQQAIEFLQKRLSAQPDHIDSWHYLGLAYLSLNQNQEAVDSFEKILQMTHLHPSCYEHLAIGYLKIDDKEKALTYFLRQLEVQPTANAFYNIGVLLSEKGRQRDAISYFQQAVVLEPLHLPAHLNLGVLFLKMQQLDSARIHYQKAAEINPDDPEIQHILMALTQNKIPDKAPAEYLKNLFDQYASYYDKHLTESLKYRVPQQLHQAIYQLIKNENKIEWLTLDLGCGTGLCGELFKEFSSRLIGIDISQEMVSVAQAKNIYDQLLVSDIEQALKDYQEVDLILAADVFTYIGELNGIFSEVKRALKKTGLFAFSVEKTAKIPFELQPTIRYAHSRPYLESLIEKYQFRILKFDEIVLRMQKNEPIHGYLVILNLA